MVMGGKATFTGHLQAASSNLLTNSVLRPTQPATSGGATGGGLSGIPGYSPPDVGLAP